MLHLYAPLAEREHRLISELTEAALAAKKANGAQLGNPSDIQVARSLGRSVQTAAADPVLFAAAAPRRIARAVNRLPSPSHIVRRLEAARTGSRPRNDW